MIIRLQLFLGPARFRAFILLLGITGMVSLILNVIVDQYIWVRPVQSLLVLIFLVGAIVLFAGRMTSEDRRRWLVIMSPAVGAVLLGLVFLPDLQLPLFGAALGWIIAGVLLFRRRVPMQYQKAIKYLRKNEYAEAVKVMDELIKNEAGDENHYRFRAELLRLWGKLGRARRDYQKMIELVPDSAVAYNGLAEVCLQAGDYEAALAAGQKAYDLAPDEWVASYNLGMIEDRLGKSEDVIEHLTRALELNVPDARHRLLIHLYLTRAFSRLGQMDAAAGEVEAIQGEKDGLEEWHLILESAQAATLRAVIANDVQAAQALINETLHVADLAREGN
jgi:tetratricopeptide (TPR) repeat protein